MRNSYLPLVFEVRYGLFAFSGCSELMPWPYTPDGLLGAVGLLRPYATGSPPVSPPKRPVLPNGSSPEYVDLCLIVLVACVVVVGAVE